MNKKEQDISLRAHLVKVLEDFLKKKIRVEDKLNAYKEQEADMKERFVDQTLIEGLMKERGEPQSKINYIAYRKTKNQHVQLKTEAWGNKQRNEILDAIDEIQVHANELRRMETESNLFFEPPFYKEASMKEEVIKDELFTTYPINKKGTVYSEYYLPLDKGLWSITREVKIHPIIAEEEEEK